MYKKNPLRALKGLILVSSIWVFSTGISDASLIISNVSYSSTQLSLTVAGTVGAGELNSTDLDSLFFGFDNGGDNSWISSVNSTASSALDVKNGGTYTISSTGTNDLSGFPTLGGYLYTNSNNPITAGETIDYDLTWIGSFDFSTYNPAKALVVQVGFTYLPPLMGGRNVLAGSVPEPSTVLLAGLGLTALRFTRRKRA